MTAQSGSTTEGRRRGIVIIAAVAAVVVVIVLIAFVFSLVSGSTFDDPNELRSAMADAGFPCAPGGPSGDRGQLSIQGCDLEDGGALVLGVYESGDLLEEHVADLRGQPRALVYGDNWFIEASFSPRPPENRELLTRMAERLDAETLNLDL
jgi:hypothetical protein